MTLLKRFNSWMKKEKTKLPPPGGYFLELTNHCNLRCSMCNFHSPLVQQRRKKGFMSTELAIRLLNEIAMIGEDRPWVALHGAGEPLLHKGLIEILRKTSNLNLNIGFLTNAVLLDKEATKSIIDTPISWIGFSIDGIDMEKFSRYRKGADYRIVVENALYFIDYAKKHRDNIRIMVNMTMQEEMRPDVERFVQFWLRYVDEVSVSPCRAIGTRDNLLAREFPSVPRIPCYMLFKMMVIYWDGEVGLCCEDWFNDGKMGSVANSSISKVWNGKGFSQARRLHKEGRFSEIGLCKDCNSWYNAIPQRYFDNELRCTVQKSAWSYSYLRER